MSDKIIALDGRKIDESRPLRDPGIAELLADVGARNDRGELKAVAIAMIDRDGSSLSIYRSNGPTTHATLVGAIEILKFSIMEAREPSYEPLEPDAG